MSLDSQNTTVFVASIGSIVTDNCSVCPTFKTWLPPLIATPVTCITLERQPLKKNTITKKAIINEAVNILRQNKVNIIGSVFTQVNVKDSEVLAYTYGYGYRYGYDDLNNKKKTDD